MRKVSNTGLATTGFTKMAALISAAFFLGLTSSLSAETFEIELKAATKAGAPSSAKITFLPTPVRILAEAPFEVMIHTGFGLAQQYSNFTPMVSVVEGQSESREDYQALYHVPVSESEAHRLARLTRQLETRALNIFEDGMRLKAHLLRDREFYLELGGQRVFSGLKDTQMRRFSLPRQGHRVTVLVPLVEFFTPERESSVRYRFFKFQQSLIAKADHVPSAYFEKPGAYFSEVLFREEKEGFIAGSNDPQNAPRRAFVFSTCVEFRDLGEPVRKPQMDLSSQCWIYDLKQSSELLPLAGEDHSRMGSYLVTREAMSVDGNKKARVHTIIDTFKNPYSVLPALKDWKALP
jgi:hypothetical protein